MTITELKIKRFLREDLGIHPKYAVYDTLKEMILLLDEDISNKQSIISVATSNKRLMNLHTRRISYFIENNHNEEKYKKIMGDNEIATAKTFVISCFEYYNERYN